MHGRGFGGHAGIQNDTTELLIIIITTKKHAQKQKLNATQDSPHSAEEQPCARAAWV